MVAEGRQRRVGRREGVVRVEGSGMYPYSSGTVRARGMVAVEVEAEAMLSYESGVEGGNSGFAGNSREQ